MSNPAQGAVGAETKFKIGDRVQIVGDLRDDNDPGQITGEQDGRFEVTWRCEDGRTHGEGMYIWRPHELRLLPAAPAALASPRADSDERTAGEDLNDRLRAAGMFTIPEMMGETPLTRWEVHAAMKSLDAFGWWLDAQVRQYLTMKAECDLSGKPEGDELYEWVLAHAAAFRTIRVNFEAARKATPAQPAGAVPDSLRALSEAASALLSACMADMGPLDEMDRDDEPVGMSGFGVGTAVTFGHLRRLEQALASHPAEQSAGSGAAREALARLRARDGEDVDAWAQRLGADLAKAGEAEPVPDSTRTGQGEAEEHAHLLDLAASRLQADGYPANAASCLKAAAYLRTLAARPAAPEAQGAEIKVDVPVMRLSDGRADYYVRITCGGREVTPYKFADRYKAEYEAAHFAWIFGLRPDEPDLLAYYEASYPNVPAPPASSGQGGR